MCSIEINLFENVIENNKNVWISWREGKTISIFILQSSFGKFHTFQPKLQVKNDWYQTEVAVVITIMVKNIKQELLKIDIDENKVNIFINHPNFEICKLCFNLSHKVVPSESSYKLYSTKVIIDVIDLHSNNIYVDIIDRNQT